MGRSVDDIAALLDVISSGPSQYLAKSNMDTGTITLGDISQREEPMSQEATSLFKEALDALGSKVRVVPVHIPSLELVSDSEAIEILWAAHSGSSWSNYLEGVDGAIKSLADLIEWHQSHPVRMF